MDLTALFWLALLFSALLPLLRQRVLEAARHRLRRQIENTRNSRVILLVHREETMSLFGIPLMRIIDIQDAEDVIRAILQTPRDMPIDPQIEDYPAASIIRAVERKEDKDIEDHTLILADQAEMAVSQMRRSVIGLLSPRLRDDLAEYVANALSTGQWTHDYPITPDEAVTLGLPVSTDMPAAILDMMSLYPQPIRRTPSVEYSSRRRAPLPPAPQPAMPK